MHASASACTPPYRLQTSRISSVGVLSVIASSKIQFEQGRRTLAPRPCLSDISALGGLVPGRRGPLFRRARDLADVAFLDDEDRQQDFRRNLLALQRANRCLHRKIGLIVAREINGREHLAI